MPVQGVGGIFFRAQDPELLAAWYAEMLGVGPSSGDEWAWSTQAGPLVFAPFPHDTDHWPADRASMLNLRVTDLDGLLDSLRAAGVDITTDPAWDTPETGRFARVTDPEGNPVELWEPPPVADEHLMEIHGPEFVAMHQRVLEVTALTSRLNALPFDDETGRARLLEQILGRPLSPDVTIYPPFYTDHGLRLEFMGRAFVNQGCTFLDQAGIRIGHRVMIAPKVTFITSGHPVDPADRKVWLTGSPIDVGENVWIGAGATILPGVTIGADSVVAAGAVVADDVPPQTLVAGPKAATLRSW